LLTLVVPHLFGGGGDAVYWGRWSFGEMTAFFGVASLFLAGAGLVAGAAGARRAREFALLCLLTFLLALGAYTPLFDLLYRLLPGFGLFRGHSKFIFFAIFFAIALAAHGLDHLANMEPGVRQRLLFGLALAPAALCALGAAVLSTADTGADGLWAAMARRMLSGGEVLLPPGSLDSPAHSAEIAAGVATAATRDLWWAAFAFGACALGLAISRRKRAVIYAVAALGFFEALFFAAGNRPSFSYATFDPGFQRDLGRRQPGDYRVLDLLRNNGGLLSGLPDLWGEDPGMLGRYGQLMGASQGVAPGSVTQNVALDRYHPLWRLLRARYAIVTDANGFPQSAEFAKAPLPRLLFFDSFELVPERDRLIGALLDPSFDPARTLLLEEAPFVLPTRRAEATAPRWAINEIDSDEFNLEVQLDQPMLMLMTDAYASGWEVDRLPESTAGQAQYRFQPGDYALRVLPLEAGDHRLRVRFRPRSLGSGATLSLASIGVCATLLGVSHYRPGPSGRKTKKT
ncbi:MAG: hypothetical protein ACC661_12785, partial [Verrucomicrobiales bacterium]